MEIADYLRNLRKKFPHLHIIFCPLTLRVVNSQSRTRFPLSKNPMWIKKMNKIIKLISLGLKEKSKKNLLIVNSRSIHKLGPEILAADGLHLSDYGKERFCTKVVLATRKWMKLA